MLKEKGFYRGVNLGGWLSQCDYSEERLDSFITRDDFARIRDWGFDHVRLPVDYDVIQDGEGRMKERGLSRVDRALCFAEKNGLNLVLDLHKTQGFSFDAGEHEEGFFENERYQEYFYAVWETFAARYGTRQDIMFDLLNEVTEQRYLKAWKDISRRVVRRIRAKAPETPILLGSYQWNSARTVPELDPPYDEGVLYNFHFYEPHDYTHQGAYWEAAARDISPRYRYEECGVTAKWFEDYLAPALEKARKEGCDLYCGEFGVIDVVPPEDSLGWFRDLHTVFEKHGIARCLWSYKQMDFGLCDSRMDAVRARLLPLL